MEEEGLEKQLKRSLTEEMVLREAANRVYTVNTEEEVLDEVIWCLKRLGREYTDISMVDESGRYIAVTRSGIKKDYLSIIEKTGQKIFPGAKWLGLKIPIYEEGNIFREAYFTKKPIVTENIQLQDKKSIIITPISRMYEDLFERASKLRTLLPLIKSTIPYKSLILMPLIIRDKSIGDITICSKGDLTEHDLKLMQALSSIAAAALEKLRLVGELKVAVKEETILRELTNNLYTAKTKDEILDNAMSGLDLLGFQFYALALATPDRKYSEVLRIAGRGFYPQKIERLAKRIIPKFKTKGYKVPIYEEGNIYKRFFEEKEPKPIVSDGIKVSNERSVIKAPLTDLYANLFERESRFRSFLPTAQKLIPLQSVIATPFVVRGKVVGNFSITSEHVLTEHDLDLLMTLSRMVSQALEKLELDEERIKLEIEIEKSIAEADYLKRIDKIKDEFIATVTHEFKTPLTSIKALAELLVGEKDEKTLTDSLSIINKESERLSRLVSDVLDLAKIESGKIEWRMERQKMSEIVTEALNRIKFLAPEKHMSIKNKVSSNLPEVLGDKDKLIQVMVNLLSNAIKFTDEGGKIEISAKEVEDFIEVCVEDTGIGISGEDLIRIFERFAQVYSAQAGRPKGTGLGLHICRHIVEHHGGKIWAESEFGKGSKFYFTVKKAEKVE